MSRDFDVNDDSVDPLQLFEPADAAAPVPGSVAHFGLTRAPFGKSRDPRLLFESSSYSAAREQMTDALARGDAIIVLTGESGTGKTTLWRRVAGSLPRPVLMSVVDSSLGFEDLMHRVLTDFHAAPPPGTRGIADLSGYDLVLMLGRVLASLPTGARAILVVDDAHSMKPSVVAQLRSLTNLETRGARFQIILVGRPALQTLLKRPETRQLQQRVGQWCKLTPLTGPEIQAYVDHRLSVAGRRPESEALMTQAAVRALTVKSQGRPETVNRLAERAMELAYERQDHQIQGNDIKSAAQQWQVHGSTRRRVGTAAASAAAIVVVSASMLWGLRHLPRTAIVTQGDVGAPPAVAGLTPSVVAETKTEAASPPAAKTSTASPAPLPPSIAPLPVAESYVVMAASFKKEESASDAVATLTRQDFPAFIRKAGVWNVVMIGPYLTMDEAKDVRDRISARSFPESRIQKQSLTDTTGR